MKYLTYLAIHYFDNYSRGTIVLASKISLVTPIHSTMPPSRLLHALPDPHLVLIRNYL